MSISQNILQEVIAALQAKLDAGGGIDAAWTYDLGPDGYLFVDCKSAPYRISRENGGGNCVFSLTLEDLWRLMSGQADSQTIFTQGKIRMSGDMTLVLKIDQMLGTYRAAQGA